MCANGQNISICSEPRTLWTVATNARTQNKPSKLYKKFFLTYQRLLELQNKSFFNFPVVFSVFPTNTESCSEV